MNTFLPNSYVFSSQKALTPHRVYSSGLDIFIQEHNIIIWLIVVVILILSVIIAGKAIDKIFNGNESDSSDILAEKFIISSVALLFSFMVAFHIFDVQRPYQDNCNFGLYTKTNLIVRQDDKKYPHSATDRKSYPYKFYVKNIDGDPDKKKHLLFLGKAKNNKIFLADKTEANKLFINYFYYVKKHHLEDKFGNELYFEKDLNTTNANGVPQYVLRGSNITLKIKPDKKQSYQIYAEKG